MQLEALSELPRGQQAAYQVHDFKLSAQPRAAIKSQAPDTFLPNFLSTQTHSHLSLDSTFCMALAVGGAIMKMVFENKQDRRNQTLEQIRHIDERNENDKRYWDDWHRRNSWVPRHLKPEGRPLRLLALGASMLTVAVMGRADHVGR